MEYELNPTPDKALKTQLDRCRPYFQNNDFSRFLEAESRFDKQPVYVAKKGQKAMEALGNEPVCHYNLRKILPKIPAYMQAVNRADLNYQQGIGILFHLFNGDKYNFIDKASDILIMTKALNASKADESLPRSLDKVKELMSAGCDGSGMGGTLYSLYITARLGIPADQAGPMITEGAKNGYTIGPFNQALKSMLPTKPDTELVVEAFNLLTNNPVNYWSACDYTFFRHLMTFAAPANGIAVNDMLAMFVSAAKSKSKRKKLEVLVENKEVTESKDKYFTLIKGGLEHFAQPYVIRRTLSEGVRDLKKLANAKSHKWGEVDEGMFVFDPKNNLWYSLGGELETPSLEEVLSGRAERVRHRFMPYDLSLLTETPFIFHIHPEELEIFTKPKKEGLAHPEFREHLSKFISSTPSRADYKVLAELIKEGKRRISPRAFIVHSLGITEIGLPKYIGEIEQMGEDSRNLRDHAILNFDLTPYLGNGEVKEEVIVQDLIQELNQIVPEGFKLNLYSDGTLS